jgi:hypothetical protein
MRNVLQSSKATTSALTAKQNTRNDRDVRWLSLRLMIIFGLALLVAAGGISLIRLRALHQDIEGVQIFHSLAHDHSVGPFSSPQMPPAGGCHYECWQNCGIYDRPVPNEHAIHSLEHDAVWITYQPTLEMEVVEQLRQLVQGRQYTLLSPYEGLPVLIVATAWGFNSRATLPTIQG